MVSVAPTLLHLRFILLPTSFPSRPLVFAITYSFSIFTLAPNSVRPLICSSIGLDPMRHPPGRGILTSPNLARIGPIHTKLALRA